MSCSLGGAKGLTLPAREVEGRIEVAMPPSTLRRPLERLVAHYRETPEEWSGHGPALQLRLQGGTAEDVDGLREALGMQWGAMLRAWRDRTPYSEGLAALERVLASLPEVTP